VSRKWGYERAGRDAATLATLEAAVQRVACWLAMSDQEAIAELMLRGLRVLGRTHYRETGSRSFKRGGTRLAVEADGSPA